MISQAIRRGAVLVLALHFLTPAVLHADSLCDACPGGSYSACHYNFPLVWRFCARLHSHWHAALDAPPVSTSYYEYRSHCPYADPATQLGFPSIGQRSKIALGTKGGPSAP